MIDCILFTSFFTGNEFHCQMKYTKGIEASEKPRSYKWTLKLTMMVEV